MSLNISKSKKVCIIRQKYYPMQRNLRRNAENLAKQGYRVNVICVGERGQSRHEVRDGIEIHRLYFSYHRNNVFWYLVDYFVFFMLVFFKLIKSSVREPYDIIEVCNVPDFLVFATLVPKLFGSKVIFNIFEKTESLFSDSFGISKRHLFTKLINFITKMCVHYADYVIFTDVLVQKQIIERDNIPSDKTTLVLNVPDESVFNLEPVCSVNDKQCFKVIVVSTILKRYGIQTMVKAVPLLLKDIPELKVDVVGNGEYLPEVRRMADDLGIASYINFTDYVPYEKVSAYIAQADVCVAPMNDDVGTPNKVLEYFALGKATVSSILPGLKALFDDDCISYFQPGDDVELSARILELYRNPDKRVILGRYAKEFYLKNRWPVMLQRYLAVYQRLSGQK